MKKSCIKYLASFTDSLLSLSLSVIHFFPSFSVIHFSLSLSLCFQRNIVLGSKKSCFDIPRHEFTDMLTKFAKKVNTINELFGMSQEREKGRERERIRILDYEMMRMKSKHWIKSGRKQDYIAYELTTRFQRNISSNFRENKTWIHLNAGRERKTEKERFWNTNNSRGLPD